MIQTLASNSKTFTYSSSLVYKFLECYNLTNLSRIYVVYMSFRLKI